MSVEITEAATDVLRIRCRSRRSAAAGYDVSAWLVRGVLVDTGFARVQRELLAALAPLPIRGVVVTHWHEDHAGNAAQLASRRLPMTMHARCEALLRERPPIRLYRSLIWGRPARLTVPLEPFDPAPLEVIATPGHTDDHVVLWDPERRTLASGDLFLGVKVRVAHVHERPSLLVESLRRVAALRPLIIFDAHRGVVPDAESALRAKIGFLEDVIAQIRALAARGCSPDEIRARVLGREDLTAHASLYEYSRRALVEAVIEER